MSAFFSRFGVVLMRLLAHLPLPALRCLGAALGLALFHLAFARRRVVFANLKLVFPSQSPSARANLARAGFVCFARAWIDRSWLWHGNAKTVGERLNIVGAEHLQSGPQVVFGPHFYGLDAGWTALTRHQTRAWATIYSHQSNAVVSDWILQGRQRFGSPAIHGRSEGTKPILQAFKKGAALYLLPDMDMGAHDSVFVPFFGVPTCTVTSLARFARVARAPVLMAATRMTPSGYTTEISPVWAGFPTGDPVADAAQMNAQLEQAILGMPEQYWWVHKRFKTRPPGETSVY